MARAPLGASRWPCARRPRIRGRGRQAWSSTRPSRGTCGRPRTTPAGAAAREASAASVLVAGAADDDLVLLDRHLDRPVAGPVLGVDRVVLHGRVQPQAIALLAVVERPLERADVARAPAEHPACAPAAAAPWARTRARGLEVLALVLALAHVLVHAQALRLLIGLAPLSLFSR